MTIIEREIEKIIEIKSRLKSNIFRIINSFNLFNKLAFNLHYRNFKEIDFLYDIGLEPIISSALEIIKTNSNFTKYPKMKNISLEFYEGFGYDLINNLTSKLK